MLEGTAHLTDVRLAREAIPGLGARMLLHDALAHAQGVA
jgi:hypothetical protein